MRIPHQASEARARVAGGCALIATLILMTLPLTAQAAPLHEQTAFSPFDLTGIGLPGELRGTEALAVDEASGNVFLPALRPESTVYVLGSEGGLPAGVASPYNVGPVPFGPEFNREASSSSIAFDNSASSPNKGTLYAVAHDGVHASAIEKFILNPASEQYELEGELVPTPSNGTLQNVTVDEEGNVYGAELYGGPSNSGVITKFSPSGEQLEQLDMTAATPKPEGLAVDSAGDLFVKTQNLQVFKFPANGLGELDPSNFTEVAVAGSTQELGIGIDRASDTLFVSLNANPFEIVEVDASSLIEKGNLGRGQLEYAGGIAVNDADRLIYVGQYTSVAAFDLDGPMLADAGTTNPSQVTATAATLNGVVGPRGAAIADCKFKVAGVAELPCEGAIPADNANHPVTAQVSGLTPNTVYEYRLVVTNANGTVETAQKKMTTEPIAKATAAAPITPSGATLNGVVRPEGTPIGECEFEYGLTTEYEASLPCDPEAGAIPADSEPHSVSAALSGLLVGTTYHFRLVASSGLGSEHSEDETFTTLGPSVDGMSFTGVTPNATKLEALVNPRGKATTYHFEYGSEGPCSASPCVSSPVPDAAAGSGSQDTEVSQLIEGLTPNTTYHFRIVVSNSDGTGHSSEASFTTYESPSALPPCPDETFRAGRPSAKLPDCRVYEQASAVGKNGNDANGGILFKVQASPSGDGITSQTYGGVPGGEGSGVYPSYLSQRGPEGWTTQGLLPPPSYGDSVQMIGWTPDLAYSFSRVGETGSDATGGVDQALLVRSSATREIQQLTPYLDKARYAFAGSSADDSKLFIEAQGPGMNLTGNARTGKDNLYLYEPGSGELSLVGVLPNGSPPPGGSFAGPFDWFSGAQPGALGEGGALGTNSDFVGSTGYFLQRMNAISTDGSKAFFTAGETGQIYLREGLGGEEPQTVHVSASQRSAPDPGGTKPSIFMGADPSGSTAFFTSCEKLTDDSTAHSTAANLCDSPEQGQDLYAYDTETHQLSDLTVDHEPGDPQGAEVMGFLGASSDGSYVYFVANGDLDGGGPAEKGDCVHTSPGFSYSGSCSVYVWHAGASKFVTRLDAAHDAVNWLPRSGGGSVSSQAPSSVSPDGQTLVFQSERSLTGYENLFLGDFNKGRAENCFPNCSELYRYHVGDDGVACVSCNPSGMPPLGSPTLDNFQNTAELYIPAGHPFDKRFVSASGNQVFFQSPDKLVADDVNGNCVSKVRVPCQQDVYEWEAAGAGSCSESSPAFSAHNGGCLYLLSSGTSSTPSYFGDASASGRDVFVFDRSQLVPSDKDELVDIYDARVEGGLASQNQPSPAPPCEGDACLGATNQPPSGQSAGSASFSGPGNPPSARCPKGKVRKGGKCVKRHKPRKHKHKSHSHKKRAGANHGGRK